METMNFEEALDQLEKMVTQLESGNLPLEQALDVFETGVKMSRICTQKLEHAEKKVELLLNVTAGQPQTAPFDVAALHDDA